MSFIHPFYATWLINLRISANHDKVEGFQPILWNPLSGDCSLLVPLIFLQNCFSQNSIFKVT